MTRRSGPRPPPPRSTCRSASCATCCAGRWPRWPPRTHRTARERTRVIFAHGGVLLAYLLVLLLWNAAAGSRLERSVLLPLQLALSAVLVRDRLLPGQPSLLDHAAVRWAFPLLFALALAQNVAAIRARGARLT